MVKQRIPGLLSCGKIWTIHFQSGSWGKYARVQNDISCLELRALATGFLCRYINVSPDDVVVSFCGDPLLHRSQRIKTLGLYDGCFVEVGIKCRGGISIRTKGGKKRKSVSMILISVMFLLIVYQISEHFRYCLVILII